MSLNQDNADEIYSAKNVQVKSSYGDKRFILKSKMQKIRATQIFTKKILAGTQQLHLNQIKQKKYIMLKIWQKFLRGQDNYLQTKSLENVCGFKILTIAILAGTKQLYLTYNLRQSKASQYTALSNFFVLALKFTFYYLFFFLLPKKKGSAVVSVMNIQLSGKDFKIRKPIKSDNREKNERSFYMRKNKCRKKLLLGNFCR